MKTYNLGCEYMRVYKKSLLISFVLIILRIFSAFVLCLFILLIPLVFLEINRKTNLFLYFNNISHSTINLILYNIDFKNYINPIKDIIDNGISNIVLNQCKDIINNVAVILHIIYDFFNNLVLIIHIICDFYCNLILQTYTACADFIKNLQIINYLQDLNNDIHICISRILNSISCFINNIDENNSFTILSLIVSFLSVLIAALAIAFGNFKICNINANVLLKQIFNNVNTFGKKVPILKSSFTTSCIMSCASPVLMLAFMIFHLKYSYFIVFLIAFFSLLHLLVLCLSLFTSNGIKYHLIPLYIYYEYLEICEHKNEIDFKERLLYDSFIQNLDTDNYYENKIVIEAIIFNIIKGICKINQCKKEQDENKYIYDTFEKNIMVYKYFYILFYDLRKYMCRNSDDSDFIECYLNLCRNVIENIEKEENFDCYHSAFSAIFRNICECSVNICNTKLFKNQICKLLKYIDKIIDEIYEYSTNEKEDIKMLKLNNTIDTLKIILFCTEIMLSSIDKSQKSSSNNFDELIDIVVAKLIELLELNSENLLKRQNIPATLNSILCVDNVFFICNTGVKISPNNSNFKTNKPYIEKYMLNSSFVSKCINNIIHDLANYTSFDFKNYNKDIDEGIKYNESNTLIIYEINRIISERENKNGRIQ